MTKIYHATDRALTELARNKYDELNSICGDARDGDDAGYTFDGALSESFSTLEPYLTEVGFIRTIDGNGDVSFTWPIGKEVQRFLRAVSTIIHIEYDGPDELNLMWNAFSLGGDDDVDYFGGYIDSIADILDEWEDPMNDNAPHELKA